MIKIIGGILIIDGLLSLLLPQDKYWLWQAGRLVRIGCGIILVTFY